MYKLAITKDSLTECKRLASNLGFSTTEFSKELYPLFRLHSMNIADTLTDVEHHPVQMLVTIRTDLTNEVIVPDDGKFYTDCTATYPSMHPLDDTVILAAKRLVTKLFDCGDHLPEVIQHTSLYPVGVCVLDDQVYVYVNVIVDCSLKSNPHFKLKDCHFEDITSLIPTSPLESNMLDKLVLVKGGNTSV